MRRSPDTRREASSSIQSSIPSFAASPVEVDELLESLKLGFQEIPRDGLYLAAKAFLQYRRQGGTKTSALPDFFIGGHAEALGIPILTRDTARYQTYFPNVELIGPPP